MQSYSVNPKFTTFTIVIRLVFMACAILSCSLYMSRYVKVPKSKRVIEQTMVAVASVLLIMFNDPFYAITVLKPNGARYSHPNTAPSSAPSLSSTWWPSSSSCGWSGPIGSSLRTASSTPNSSPGKKSCTPLCSGWNCSSR